jgi:hypothetical protein
VRHALLKAARGPRPGDCEFQVGRRQAGTQRAHRRQAGNVWPPLPPPVTIRRNALPFPARCLPCATQILPALSPALFVMMPARAEHPAQSSRS